MELPKPPQPPPAMIETEDILPAVRDIVEKRRTARDDVVRNNTPEKACFASVIQPLADIEDRTGGALAVIAMLRYASTEKAAREASEEAHRRLSEATAEFTSRRDLYQLIKAVKDKAEPLHFEEQKYLDELLLDYTRCGHGSLQDHQIQTYLESRNTIDRQRHRFTRNIMDETGGLWLSRSDLDGVPDSDLSRFHYGSNRGADECFVPFTKHNVDLVLKYAKNSSVRKRLYVADNKKLEDNVNIFKDVILRRDENARMLGYPSHAAFRLEKRAAKTSAWVHGFLDQLQDVLLPQGRRELQLLIARKASYLQNAKSADENPGIMPPWDFRFYKRLAEEELCVEHNRIAEYFPLRTTVLHMLDIFACCLQMRFEKIPPQQVAHSIWHRDVEAWTVWDERPDEKGAFIGYLYTDLLFRENKHRGNQDVNLQSLSLTNTILLFLNSNKSGFSLISTATALGAGYILQQYSCAASLHQLQLAASS